MNYKLKHIIKRNNSFSAEIWEGSKRVAFVFNAGNGKPNKLTPDKGFKAQTILRKYGGVEMNEEITNQIKQDDIKS